MLLSFTWDGLVANDHSFLTEVKEEKFLLNNPHSIPFHSIHLPASNHLQQFEK